MTGKIFISYRRSDSDAWAVRLYERLLRRYPRKNVFLDIYGKKPFWTSWQVWLDKEVATCDLMLVLIGDNWADDFIIRNEVVKDGWSPRWEPYRVKPGIYDRDYVRFELASALTRGIPIVPVLQGDASMPPHTSLPDNLRSVTKLQPARLRIPSLDLDVEALTSRIASPINR